PNPKPQTPNPKPQTPTTKDEKNPSTNEDHNTLPATDTDSLALGPKVPRKTIPLRRLPVILQGIHRNPQLRR
ncbi:MAG: hypothetical protein AAFO91_06650, partial [Bacteroidota bacterium]